MKKWRANENKLRDPLKKIELADLDFTGYRSVIAKILLLKGDWLFRLWQIIDLFYLIVWYAINILAEHRKY